MNSWKKSQNNTEVKTTRTWRDIIRGTKTYRLNQIQEEEADKEILDFIGDAHEDKPGE